MHERPLHYLWNTNMAALLNTWNKYRKEFCAWPIWVDITRCLENSRVIYSLSNDRQLYIRITVVSNLGIHAHEARFSNKPTKCTGSYFTLVNVSSYMTWNTIQWTRSSFRSQKPPVLPSCWSRGIVIGHRVLSRCPYQFAGNTYIIIHV